MSPSREGRTSGSRFLGLALLFAFLLAVAGSVIASQMLDTDVNWVASSVTAVIVGAFVALLLLGRRPVRPALQVTARREETAPEVHAKGFDVVQRRTR